ncbi:MAG: hypothetical protein AB1455_09880 [Pseudomonadota bacterium]
MWSLIAKLITRPAVADWLIERAKRTPYQHITSADGQHVYMGRWWLFNAYPGAYGDHPQPRHIPWLPSVRIHYICRADQDRDLHDHPWNARTIVLRGWYREERPWSALVTPEMEHISDRVVIGGEERYVFDRAPGYTGRLLFGQYHRISEVSEGGVWTLFITGRKRGTWGFMVKGKKVPWRTYLGLDSQEGGAA